jgi:WD40 repeat protein
MKLKKLDVLTHINSLIFDELTGLLFYSMGSCLCVQDQTGKIFLKQILTEGGKIYGIRVLKDYVYIFGQRIIQIFQLEKNKTLILKEVLNFEAKFWILDIQMLEDKIILGYSNNSVEIFSFQNSTIKSLKHVKGTLNCLLYSMKICGDLDDLIIASGTIFHDILIWGSDGKLISTLKGHEGVIFCVEISKDKDYLISGSDDRTIRLWNLKNPSIPHVVFYGHTARIWDCKFCGKSLIASCAEDSLVKLWNFDGNCIQTFLGHTGKNIWRLAIHPNENLIASAGADSSIKFWKIHSHKSEVNPIKNIKGMSEINREIILIDKNGSLFNLSNNNLSTIFESKETKNFCTLSCHPLNEDIFVIGDVFGNIFIYDNSSKKYIFELNVSKSMVMKIHWFVKNEQIGLLVSSADGNLSYYIFKENSLELINSINTGKKKITCICTDENSNLLIGDSKGYIKLIKIKNDKLSDSLSIVRSHQNVNVSDIKFKDQFFYSIGWDGHMCVHIIEDDKIHKLNYYKLNSIIPSLEKIIFTKNGNLLLFGYSGNYFVVYDFTQKYRVL